VTDPLSRLMELRRKAGGEVEGACSNAAAWKFRWAAYNLMPALVELAGVVRAHHIEHGACPECLALADVDAAIEEELGHDAA